jgi:diguanylate cyclase (GGDEF)-like protein
LLTANDRKDSVVAGLQAGADDYLTKPFDRDELYARLQVGKRVVELQTKLNDRVQQLERAEAELRSLSLTDDLTGLHNRRGFFVHAEQQLKDFRRKKRDLVVFYADMDGLKQINDTLGHAQGSRAIVEVAELLKRTFRESDVIARVGGDEFIVLAADVTLELAELMNSRLVENLRMWNDKNSFDYKLSLSVGIKQMDPNRLTLQETIAQADSQMYEDKKHKGEITVVRITKPVPKLEQECENDQILFQVLNSKQPDLPIDDSQSHHI